MRTAAHRVIEAGQSPYLRDLFRSLAEIDGPEGPKFGRKALHVVAQAVACRAYEKMTLELVHLVRAAALTGGRLGYEGVFWGMERASSGAFRGHFAEAGARPGLALTGGTVTLDYPDGRFAISYWRMPTLSAFLEFCVAALGYAPMADILDGVEEPDRRAKDLSLSANALSRALYEFLGAHLPAVQAQRKFRDLIAFLQERRGERFGPDEIDDAAILAFWCEASGDPDGSDFRAYRTVFLAMLRLIALLEDGDALDRFEHTHAIGSDREAGEIDPATLDPDEWADDPSDDPLAAFAEPPLDSVKFLNKRETEALQLPSAEAGRLGRLSHSYLRAECFGPGQFRLIQALRRKADPSEIRGLADEAAPEDFAARIDLLHRLDAHLEKTALASLHALGGDDIPELVSQRARKAFDGIARKGFDRAGLSDPTARAAFEAAAGPLTALRERLQDLLSVLGAPEDWDGRFEEDRAVFAAQFRKLYGGEE